MSKLIQRKFWIQVTRRSQSDTRSQMDPASLIKERERTRGIKAAKIRYHRLVVEKKMMTVAVIRIQISRSRGILNLAKKLI